MVTLAAVILAAALVAGAPSWLVAVGAAGALWPPVGLVALAAGVGLSVTRRLARSGSPTMSETVLFRAMAAELRAGASLRLALGAAATRVPELGLGGAARQAAAGVPAEIVADELRERLPRNGRLAAAAFALASETGARAAVVFETLALRAAAIDDLARERHLLTVQARMSALVVAGLPLLLLIAMVVSGRAQTLLAAGTIGWAIAVTGSVLEVAGVTLVVVMLRRADR